MLGLELGAAEYAASPDVFARDHFGYGGGRRICPGNTPHQLNKPIITYNLQVCMSLSRVYLLISLDFCGVSTSNLQKMKTERLSPLISPRGVFGRDSCPIQTPIVVV